MLKTSSREKKRSRMSGAMWKEKKTCQSALCTFDRKAGCGMEGVIIAIGFTPRAQYGYPRRDRIRRSGFHDALMDATVQKGMHGP